MVISMEKNPYNTAASFDKEARHITEALRSGIPSRAVGQYFTEARPKILKEISSKLTAVVSSQKTDGMIVTGKYGEGKTHLLNTVFNMATERNMVVSFLSLSKETPLDKLHFLYPKLMANTYLPGRSQPGFDTILENMTPNSPIASEMVAFAAKHLQTDKLYYLLRAYLGTEDQDERFQLQADIEGDFIANNVLKQIYRRIYNQPVKYNVSFSKTKHMADYFTFMSHLFVQQGYDGWVILLDEGELMGRLAKKTRLNAYRNLGYLLLEAEHEMESVFTMIVYSASYIEDVIDGKHEYENLAELFPDNQEPAKSILTMITKAPQLVPLTREEIRTILTRIKEFHQRAYNWEADIALAELEKATRDGGYLLRTKIRAAIELLDQKYQYGDTGNAVIGELTEGSLLSLAESEENERISG